MEFKLVKGKNNEEILSVQGLLLHSKYNPVLQAEKKAKEVYKPNYVHVLFGYGNHYLIDALVKEFKNNEILIVIDPLISTEVIKPNITYKNEFIFVHNEFEKIKTFLDTLDEIQHKGLYTTICSFNYDKLFPKEYKYFLESVRDIQQSKVVNDNTVMLRAENWQYNFLQNLESMIDNNTIKKLSERYTCPIVIASGGPSLTKQLPLIKKYRNSIILVASGSTINSLLNDNISPDYVLSIDGDIANNQHFKDIYSDKINLVYSYFNYPEVRKHFKNQYYFSDSLESKNTIFLKKFIGEDIPTLVGGGSVAHYALSFAEYITEPTIPIAIVGQDLAYTDNVTHAKGNKQQTVIKEEKKYIYLDGYYGEKVKSDLPFNSMKVGFENLINNFLKNVDRIYNCTEGGVRINGLKQLPFKTFLETQATDSVKIYNLDDSKNERIIDNKKIDEYLNKCERALELISKGLMKLERNKALTYFDKNVIQSLDQIDDYLREQQDELPLQYIMQLVEIVLLKQEGIIENETTSKIFREKKDANEFVYKKINEVIELFKEKLIKIKNR